ncbi:hypothetical protein VP01_3164g5 [Puccinia sorghi]|uniref:Uncharacterized protein n=1 Tax=Puccinia sorghi TaxID=27349 RepID=A0A0L6UYQ2_9BASI|nr:hypothetical protein VP01_3164g5 [Puccinia sorghi]
MPINFYADDRSGNKSKRWSKNISFYCMLSGISQKMNNVEYKFHFISTSNVAEVLEIAESVADQLNDLATNCCVAYDPMIQPEVLIMSMPLCFMEDSPMADEVTNTPHPGRANNLWNGPTILSIHKSYGRYQNIIHKMTSLPIKRKRESMILSQIKSLNLNPRVHLKESEFERYPKTIQADSSTSFLVLDVFLLGIVEDKWRSCNTDTLNIPPVQAQFMINHYKSFIGKYFQTVIQAAPFIFFPIMTQFKKDMWISLCQLGSLILQTRVPDMHEYIDSIKTATQSLLYNLVKMNSSPLEYLGPQICLPL